MKAEYIKLDRFVLSVEQISRLTDASAFSGLISEITPEISLPAFNVMTDDGVYYTFVARNDYDLLIHSGNSFATLFDCNVKFAVGGWLFTPRYYDEAFGFGISLDKQTESLYFDRLLRLYRVLNKLSLERPEVMKSADEEITFTQTVKEKGRYKNKHITKLVRSIYIDFDELDKPHKEREITCPCWGVAGHYRHYKSGKVVYIAPFKKGKKRDDPEAYTPKNYTI